MTLIKTTCQVCGRPTLTRVGSDTVHDGAGYEERIAHHGYSRPHGSGYQTASCFGARWRPYEEACDALPPVIFQEEQHLFNLREALRAHRTAPPKTLTWHRSEGQGKKRRDWSEEVSRPSGFKAPLEPSDRGAAEPGSYLALWAELDGGIQRDIRWTQDALTRLRVRLRDWVAPPG